MWTTQLLVALSASRCLPLVHAVPYENVDELPKAKYDFIIVGGEFCCIHQTRSTATNHRRLGGTAGNTIANRLTENADVSVLVLQAGVVLPRLGSQRLTKLSAAENGAERSASSLGDLKRASRSLSHSSGHIRQPNIGTNATPGG